ncbi:hypothetical protein [Streptomyces sp. VRA16 Mangrove soil]|uniref:hypothetical protein n=1 Tax=Streptomyces sp. VRA16 Mangrove soil TaxID=2817434 RepID=UPI001A9DD9A4|nr:hypothetical protein [Streptomyces sp. VRA16 Mangrove soil]MBO1337388.1 hypothetical protein [Streptomyces sp. VRA16 Mangrove soil]
MKRIVRRASVTALLAATAFLPLAGAAQAATPQQTPTASTVAHPCGDDWECWHHWHHDGIGLGLGLGLGIG